ncbi:MAG: hypothetical protein HY736_21005 [Verrucomicrobia bacterium]|nr:hypothetical protein [Verrucomicrobiota bacterium]
MSRKGVNVAEVTGETAHNATFGINAAYQRILAGLVFTAVWFLALHLLRRMPHGPTPPANGPERSRAWRWMLANGLAGPVLGASSYQ